MEWYSYKKTWSLGFEYLTHKHHVPSMMSWNKMIQNLYDTLSWIRWIFQHWSYTENLKITAYRLPAGDRTTNAAISCGFQQSLQCENCIKLPVSWPVKSIEGGLFQTNNLKPHDTSRVTCFHLRFCMTCKTLHRT